MVTWANLAHCLADLLPGLPTRLRILTLPRPCCRLLMLLGISLLLLTALLCAADTVAADDTPEVLGHATVQAHAVSLRVMPDGDADVVSAAIQGNALEVIGQSGDCAWLQVVTPYGASGWVPGAPDIVLLDRPCADLVPAPGAPAPITATRQVTVTTGVTTESAYFAIVQAKSLAVRKQPSDDAPLITVVLAGDRLEVIGQTDDCTWLQVVPPYASPGISGWIPGTPDAVTLDRPCIARLQDEATKPVSGSKPVTITQTAPVTAKPITLPPSALATYTNVTHFWSISYPEQWTLDDEDFWSVTFGDEAADTLCTVSRSALVEFTTVEEAFDDVLAYYAEYAVEQEMLIEVSDRREITLPGGEAGLEVLIDERPGAKTHLLVVLTGSTFYWVGCETSRSAWIQWEGVFDQIIRSFTLLPLPVSHFGDAAAVAAKVEQIRTQPPTREDTFDEDTGRWSPDLAGDAQFAIGDGQLQLCANSRSGGGHAWWLRRVMVKDFYAEIEVLNFGDTVTEKEWLNIGMGFHGGDIGAAEASLTSHVGDIGYYITILLAWNDETSEYAALADDYVLTPMTEAQAERLRFGVLVVGDEITLLLDDAVIATVYGSAASTGEFYLFGATPQGCYLAVDNFRLWKLDDQSDLPYGSYALR